MTRRRDTRRFVTPVPPPVDPARIASQGVLPYRGADGSGGWYVLEPDGQPFTQDGALVVWDGFGEAYDNRRIHR